MTTIDTPLDPIAELEKRATQQRTEEEAAEAFSVAVTRLLRGKITDAGRTDLANGAFFATLAMRLKRKPDWNIETACVDGKTLRYNPEFWLQLPREQQVFVLAHEVLHCANAHQVRRGDREARRWNVACDLAINDILRDAGFQPCDGVLFPEKYGLDKGRSAEEYFEHVPEQQGGTGDDPGGCGGVEDGADDEAGVRQQEAEWKRAVTQAAKAAAERGELSSGMERFIAGATAPRVDWRAELREFVNSHAKSDYSWIPPNRRFIHMGLYLPSLHSEEMGDITVAVDCSGSIGEQDLVRFAAEIEELASVARCKITVLYHDSEVCKVQEWEPSEGPLRLSPVGGGGTDHVPVFDWINRRQPPTCVVCLTDLWSRFPDRAPAYPVLWVTESDREGPFGRTIRVKQA